MTDNLLPFILLALAVYRICHLIVEDAILDVPRNALFRRFPPEKSALGYLMTCYWCTSIWVALVMTVLYILFAPVMIIVAFILALSAVASILAERT